MIPHKTFEKLAYIFRNYMSREMFIDMRRVTKGNVLDIGGYDFYKTAKKRSIPFNSWTVLENDESKIVNTMDEKIKIICGDGQNMEFKDEKFDTVICLQVLEHVYKPIEMVKEAFRVLKKGGYAVFLIPCTSTLHMEPFHYYNFTKFWVDKVMEDTGFIILKNKPIGGVWTTEASHMIYFILQSIRRKLKSPIGEKRSLYTYLLYPLMLLYAMLNIIITMFLSIGDFTEEPNNHLVVVRRPG